MTALVPNDNTVLDLLRKHERMTVSDFESALGVTATAVRQRLNRLLGMGFIEREKDPAAAGRGRPSHWYRLTSVGLRKTGNNFADLALILWEEMRHIRDPEVRRGLLNRISSRLAAMYRDQVEADVSGERPDLATRAARVAGIFSDRQIPFTVTQAADELPVLTALACPYPDLAERDRSVCAMERLLFSELLGQRVTLDQCRLDGQACCTFQLQPSSAG